VEGRRRRPWRWRWRGGLRRGGEAWWERRQRWGRRALAGSEAGAATRPGLDVGAEEEAGPPAHSASQSAVATAIGVVVVDLMVGAVEEVAGMVSGKVLLVVVGGKGLVRALGGAGGRRHRRLEPTRLGGRHPPHCHVWSWLCPAPSRRGLDRWGAITSTGAGTSVMIAVCRVLFQRHGSPWGPLGGGVARYRLCPPL
jgi:hypothetical protein